VKEDNVTKRPSMNQSFVIRRFRRLSAIFSVKDGPPVLVQLDVNDDNVAGMNADGHARTVRLVALDTVYMDHPLLAVHLSDLALTSLVLSSDDPHLIVFPDGK